MKKVVLVLWFVLCANLFTGCDLFRDEKRVYADPHGSKEEQIAYHRNERDKYQKAYEEERARSIKSLQSRHMSEVRRSNNKQTMYQKKAQEHQAAIDLLRNDN